MAKAKDFTKINTGRVAGNIAQATSRKGQQAPVTEAEAEVRAEDLRTQGRKGCKATRINMAFTPSNYDFLKIMASVTGKTMTEFANLAIEAYRKDHSEVYERAKEFMDSIVLSEPKE